VIFNFFFTGCLSFYYNRKNGIIKGKELFIANIKIAAVISLILILILAAVVFTSKLGLVENEFLVEEPVEVVVIGLIFMFLGFWLAMFISIYIFIITGCGLIGVMVAFARGATPEILRDITKISKNTSVEMEKKNSSTYWKYYGLQWFFNIPYVLDTNEFRLAKFKRSRIIPWRDIRNAVLLQILFGTVIVVYISFNPILLQRMSVTELISVASNITVIIPMIILPWFVYYRLNARIKGPIRSFKLYHGIKHRMFRTMVAVGTLLLLVRFGLNNDEIGNIIAGFITYFIFFTITLFLFTFVYFNYFENDLAKDITRRFKELKKSSKKKID
jgi:hypothetical protein